MWDYFIGNYIIYFNKNANILTDTTFCKALKYF